jgi:hypothetical protein
VLAVDERTNHPRHATDCAVRSQQKPALGCLAATTTRPPDAVAGRAREGIDVEDLLEEGRRRAFAQRRLASVGASRDAGTMAGGPSAAAGAP